jgi:putative addiction module component (TIGR02574 family)
MPPTMQDLGIDRLSIEDRLALAQQLWQSVATDLEQQGLTPAQRAELERRLADADANPGSGIPWDVIRAEARARWQRSLSVFHTSRDPAVWQSRT